MAKVIRRLLAASCHNSLFISLVQLHITLTFLLLGSTRTVGLLFLFCISLFHFRFSSFDCGHGHRYKIVRLPFHSCRLFRSHARCRLVASYFFVF